MSALPPTADIRQRIEHVCFVPLADILTSPHQVRVGPPRHLTVSLALAAMAASSPCFKAFRKSGYCAFHRHKVEGAIPKHLAIRV